MSNTDASNDAQHPVYQLIDKLWEHIRETLYQGDFRYEPSVRLLTRHLEIAQEMNHPLLEGRLYSALGLIELELGRYASSETYFRKALEVFEKIDDQVRLGMCLSHLGELCQRFGEPQKAIEYHVRAQENARAQHHVTGELVALKNEGLAWVSIQQIDRAIPLFMRAVELSKEVASNAAEIKVAIGETYAGLANAYLMAGDLATAWQYARQSLAISQDHRQIQQIASTYQVMAQIATTDPASEEDPAVLFKHGRDHWQRAQAFPSLARMLIIEGDYWARQKARERALACYQEAATILDKFELTGEAEEARQRALSLG